MATKRAAPKARVERKLNIAYIGNFEPEHSTENHVARALEVNGHTVYRIQENKPHLWDGTATNLRFGTIDPMPDLFLWTRTGWDYTRHGYTSQSEAIDHQWRFLLEAHRRGVPTVGYHLDLWWGLKRQHQVFEEPFFKCDLVCTADGGSDDKWSAAGVNHHWMPPGVSAAECEAGMFRDEFRSRIAFVGNHAGEYHEESKHRFALVNWLADNYPNDIKFWPKPGQHAVRGADLRDLYASVDVVVGDSCLVGTGHTRYVSDRLPETTGRGAYLLHPGVEGVTDGTEWRYGPTWCGGDHLGTWAAGDRDDLGAQIERALANPSNRREVAAAGKAHTVEHHSYERRTQQLVQLVHDEGLLDRGV